MSLKDFTDDELAHREEHRRTQEHIKALEEEIRQIKERFEIHREAERIYPAARRGCIPQPAGGQRR